MKRQHVFIPYALLIFVITSLACSLTSNLARNSEPTATRPRHFVVLPPAPVASEPLPATTPLPASTDTALIGEPTSIANEAGQVSPAIPTATPFLPRPPRPTATPNNFLAVFSELLNQLNEPTATPTHALYLVALPTVSPTPTATATFTPSPTPTDTPTSTITPTPGPTNIPTDTPPPAPTSIPTPMPPPLAQVESAFISPLPTPEAESGFDFLLAEFYNSPTTNSFLVIYVAIVDANEIPIGDMKIVGTRLDHNLTYESPLSTWHFEGYNAPGEVIKSGNVKFEPPSGMETTSWVLHLEDTKGNRLSEDVPYDTDVNNKQWYFIKFRRRF
jgi:hypothetical protein